ncbi:MAG: zinc ribbon domain-containing protein [Anaerolineae bacterium]
MAKKQLGYTRLEWVCPNCETRNPGPQKTCLSCGFAQPEDIEFQQPAGEQLITDQDELAQAKAGPDIHCFYCGTRNPAGAKTCSQCGGDLTQGKARHSGRVVGAHKTGPVQKIACPNCGTANPANAAACASCGAALTKKPAPKKRPVPAAARPAPKPFNRLVLIGIVVAFLLVVGVCAFLTLSTNDLTGSVQSTAWTRSIGIEALVPVEHETWRDEIPAGAVMGVCSQKVHHTQDNPAPNAQEVCGTPYTVDTGTGYGQVVQDCQYQVYADYCQYTVDEWREVDRLQLSGSDGNPRWPADFRLAANQREGSRAEEYTIIFDADGKQYTYTTKNAERFIQAEIGSRWVLKVNKLNAVIDIEPAR